MDRHIKDVEIKRANAEDIKAFYAEGSPKSCYAWVAYYKGVPTCLAGVTIERRAGCVAFCDIKENDAPKMTIWRTANVLFSHMKSLGLPMIAIYCFPDAQRRGQEFVKRLGFQHVVTKDGVEFFKMMEA